MDKRLARNDAHRVHLVQIVGGEWQQAARLQLGVDVQLL
jgi:hypothetical protein